MRHARARYFPHPFSRLLFLRHPFLRDAGAQNVQRRRQRHGSRCRLHSSLGEKCLERAKAALPSGTVRKFRDEWQIQRSEYRRPDILSIFSLAYREGRIELIPALSPALENTAIIRVIAINLISCQHA